MIAKSTLNSSIYVNMYECLTKILFFQIRKKNKLVTVSLKNGSKLIFFLIWKKRVFVRHSYILTYIELFVKMNFKIFAKGPTSFYEAIRLDRKKIHDLGLNSDFTLKS